MDVEAFAIAILDYLDWHPLEDCCLDIPSICFPKYIQINHRFLSRSDPISYPRHVDLKKDGDNPPDIVFVSFSETENDPIV